MNIAFSFAAGLIFGLGLIVAGMSDPGKVIGFLDIARTVEQALERMETAGELRASGSLDQALETDRRAREVAEAIILPSRHRT